MMLADHFLSVLTLVLITLGFFIPFILVISTLLPFTERKNVLLIMVCSFLVVLLYVCAISFTSSLYGIMNTLLIILVQLILFVGMITYGYLLYRNKQSIPLTTPLAILAGILLGISITPATIPMIGVSISLVEMIAALIVSYALLLGLQELLFRMIILRLTPSQKISWSLAMIACFIMFRVGMLIMAGSIE